MNDLGQFGFRLEHDDARHAIRGGSHGSTPDGARDAGSTGYYSKRSYALLGFRLCVTWREE